MTRWGVWLTDLPNRRSWRCRLGLHRWQPVPFPFGSVELCRRCGWDR